MVLEFGEKLTDTSIEAIIEEKKPAIVVTTSKRARKVMEQLNLVYEGEIEISKVEFCKIETQQECLAGSLCIPKLLDILGSRYKMLFFINRMHIVIVNDDDFSERLIRRIQRRRTNQGDTKEKFLYNYILEFMNRDLEILVEYERKIMKIEEEVLLGRTDHFQETIMPLRRKILMLRGYYDELMDMGKELEENENLFFAKKQIIYFGTITDRADRLMGKTVHLLEYLQQVQDAYQSQIDAKQNSNMQFLTIISTIFFPLTLITSWYGMNFKNMPELESGYPGVICLSIIVLILCILLFKRKKIF
ncbi:MAG: CorA family divalent cation transporter [Lachnospiraceae bacterium]|nr:CorA family divalent cation transporter [Lachnospiraceae bacterium]